MTSDATEEAKYKAFFDAIANGDVQAVRATAARIPSISSAEDFHGEGAIEWCVTVLGSTENDDPRPIVQELIGLGADINRTLEGTSALWSAAAGADSELAEWLIAHGADPNIILSEDGNIRETVLDVALTDQWLGLHAKIDYQPLIDVLRRHGGKCISELEERDPSLG